MDGKKIVRPFFCQGCVLQQPCEVVTAPILQMRGTVALINEATVPSVTLLVRMGLA